MKSLFFEYRRGFGRERFEESFVALEIIHHLALISTLNITQQLRLRAESFTQSARTCVLLLLSLWQDGRDSYQDQVGKQVGLITANKAY